MRVLYLTDAPILGGTGRILQSWLLFGRKTGNQACVALRAHGEFPEWLEKEGIDYQINPMPFVERLWPFPALKQAWRLARWARQRKVDIIHCNEHNVYPFAQLLRRFLKRPMVCHVRFRLEAEWARWAFGKHRCPDALLWTSEQQRLDSTLAVSGIVPPERQHLVYLGFDLASFGNAADTRQQTREKWSVRPEEIVIGTASALRPIKRLEDFVELVATLAKKDERIVGLLAGDAIRGEETYRDLLMERIGATGLGRRFQWVGYQEPIEPFHHAADIFVSTSAYETFGNSVCEAMACRRPVAAYSGGSVQEVVGETGRIVETGDLQALVAAVTELVQSPELRQMLGDSARQRVVDYFNPAKSYAKLNRIYDSLLKKTNGKFSQFGETPL
jgi:L-malate glycosyltransferase